MTYRSRLLDERLAREHLETQPPAIESVIAEVDEDLDGRVEGRLVREPARQRI